MGLRKSKPSADSPEARLNAAHSIALGAVSVLTDAVEDLEHAASVMAEVEDDATAEAARQVSLANDAIRAGAEHLAVAERIRALLGG